MMLIYLTFLPGLILIIIMGIKLLRFNNQNNALYDFCQLRRDIMSYLRENYGKISPDEFSEIEKILGNLNKTIHYFHDLKRKHFNFKNFYQAIDQIVTNSKKIEKKVFKFDSVKQFQEQYAIAHINAFAELVPFFKWRLTAKLMFIIANLLLLFGMRTLMQTYDWFKNQTFQHRLNNRFRLT